MSLVIYRVGFLIMTSTLAHQTSTVGTDLTRRMADALSVPDGGFSIDPRTGRGAVQGFAVAVHPDRERKIQGPVSAGDVSAYVFDNADVLGVGTVVGGWRNPEDGLAYLDVSRVVPTRAEARALARRHDQLAYFDFSAGQSVTVSA